MKKPQLQIKLDVLKVLTPKETETVQGAVGGGGGGSDDPTDDMV